MTLQKFREVAALAGQRSIRVRLEPWRSRISPLLPPGFLPFRKR